VLIDIRTLYSVRVGVSREIYFGFFFPNQEGNPPCLPYAKGKDCHLRHDI
jgi:hypothetical protein